MIRVAGLNEVRPPEPGPVKPRRSDQPNHDPGVSGGEAEKDALEGALKRRMMFQENQTHFRGEEPERWGSVSKE